MHPLQCHGPSRPVSMFSDSPGIAASAYTSPSTSSPASSIGLSSDGRLETACSPVTSYSPSSTEQSPSLAFQQLHQHQSSPESRKFLKRRASQGSVPAKPSSVSRFLSRNPAASNSATSTIGGGTRGSREEASARTQSFDSSSLRLSTASESSRSGPTAWQNEYSAALPPTPPEDNDDTVSVAWNPNGMLLVEPQLNPGQGPGSGPGPLVGQHPSNLGGGHAKAAPTVDGISSPSDQLSSAAASPGSNDMDCDYNTWLESGIDAASRFQP